MKERPTAINGPYLPDQAGDDRIWVSCTAHAPGFLGMDLAVRVGVDNADPSSRARGEPHLRRQTGSSNGQDEAPLNQMRGPPGRNVRAA